MIINSEILKTIAEDLECNLKVFINKTTYKVISYSENIEEHLTKDELKEDLEYMEIKKNFSNYIEIEKMTSSQSFAIMENFIDTIDNLELQKLLIIAISKKRPFANFNHIIHNSDYDKQWFEFKNFAYYVYVQNEINYYFPSANSV